MEDATAEVVKMLNPSPEALERMLREGTKNHLEDLQVVLFFRRVGLITEEQTREILTILARGIAKAYYEKHGPPGPILRYASP